MSGYCQVAGRRPRSGNNVSRSQVKTKRWSKPDVHTKRYPLASQNRFVRLTVSVRGQKVIDTRGIERVVAEMRRRGERL